jgi:hypothetical protein
LDKLEGNKDIRHTHGKKIHVIERFVIDVLQKGIISCFWEHSGARLDILWKENIAFLWVLENNFISTIAGDSDFSWPWDWLHWKNYLLIFPCIKRTSESEVLHVICVNLKAMWSWTLNWKQIWEANKHDLDKLERNKDIRHTYGNKIYVIERFVINVL